MTENLIGYFMTNTFDVSVTKLCIQWEQFRCMFDEYCVDFPVCRQHLTYVNINMVRFLPRKGQRNIIKRHQSHFMVFSLFATCHPPPAPIPDDEKRWLMSPNGYKLVCMCMCVCVCVWVGGCVNVG